MDYLEKIEKWVDDNRDYILECISGLIQIRTTNQPPGGLEKAGQDYIADRISDFIPEKDIDIFGIYDIVGIKDHPMFFPTIDGVKKGLQQPARPGCKTGG